MNLFQFEAYTHTIITEYKKNKKKEKNLWNFAFHFHIGKQL